jgi:geranylgeranyl diphosphate synthase type I
MTFLEILNKYQHRVNKELDDIFKVSLQDAQKLGDFHVQYYKNLRDFVMRGGKRLRPTSFIMAYKGVGGKDEESVIKVSPAIELLHNSTLIHDDIMDEDHIRRGGPTFHIVYKDWFEQNVCEKDSKRFGDAIAILGGDNLFEMGLSILTKANFSLNLLLQVIDIYRETYKKICEGQILDIFLENCVEVTEEEYFNMISMKTGTLFVGSLLMGGTLGDGSPKQVETLKKYSLLMAHAFQIQDDILGTFGDERETGKPTDSDIRQGKRTLMVMKALEMSNVQDKEILLDTLGNKEAPRDDVEHVKEIICQTGALDYVKEKASGLAKSAIREILKEKEIFTVETTEFFNGLAEFVLNRKL